MAIQTAERSSHLDPSENVIFQRHMVAYKKAAKLINGTVLEIGCGEGYGISELAKYSKKYIINENDAKKEKKGLWAGNFEMPWEWRKKRK